MKFFLLLLCLLFNALLLSAQHGSVKGKIITTDGLPAQYVNVHIESLKKMTLTDEFGKFVMNHVKEGTHTLTVSHTGLQSQHKTFTVISGKTIELSFTLPETAQQLGEVFISGNRSANRPLSIGKAGLAPLDNPQSVGVISNIIITDQQVLRLGDVVKNVSGVSLTQQRQGVAETFSARGYSIGVGGGGGSIFKNGIISNTAGFPEASTLESIEVLKGSSALLYGNTSGGVIINMVTKKPKYNWGGNVAMRYGSYGLCKPTVDVYGPLSKKIAFRVVATNEHSNSFRDVVNTKRTYVNPSLLYTISKKTTILFQGDYLDANFTPDNGIGILNNNIDPVIPASRSRFINTSWAYYKLKQASGNITIEHSINDNWKLNFIAALQTTNVNAFGTGVPNTVAANGDWNRSLSKTTSSENDYTLQANLNGRFKTGKLNHQFLLGTDYVAIKTTSDVFRITNSNNVVGAAYDKINILNSSLYTPRTDIPNYLDTGRTATPSFRLGYYAQDLISIAPKLKVLVGLRWSYLKNQPATISNYIKNTETKTSIVDNSAFSPKAAIIYQPTENSSVYAGYSNNFITNTGTDIYNNPISPSIINQYEVGMKEFFLNGKLNANISVYRIINSNLAQQSILKADGTPNTDATIKELTGQTTSDGFEMDLNGNLSKNFYFVAGYGFNNARYTKSLGTKGSVVEGEKLTSTPEHTANGTIFYTFNGAKLKGLKVGASAFYTGKRFGGNQNTNGQTPAYNRQVPLTGFSTIDISAGYCFNNLSLLIKLSNIGNTLNYLAHDRYSINPIPPRQFMTTLSYKF